jgi:aminoglycoside 3-N-acetyltransferase
VLKSAFKRQAKAILGPPLAALGRLRRQRQLVRELPAVTRAQLLCDLAALSLPPGGILLVHSSLKRLGFVEGGAEGLLDALVATVVEGAGGTLCLPAFSIDGSMRDTLASGRVFDVRTTPSNLGAVPEAFRRRPGVRRSVHPTHSIAALGPQAEWIVAEHHRCGSSFGKGSPMARILEAGGHLAGLGTELGTVTFYHCLEDLEPDFPLAVYSDDSPFTVRCRDWLGDEHRVTLPAHSAELARRRIDRKEKAALRAYFTRWLEAEAGLRWFPLGQSRSWTVPLPAMYRECRRLMREGVTIYSTEDELIRHGAGCEPKGARA